MPVEMNTTDNARLGAEWFACGYIDITNKKRTQYFILHHYKPVAKTLGTFNIHMIGVGKLSSAVIKHIKNKQVNDKVNIVIKPLPTVQLLR